MTSSRILAVAALASLASAATGYSIYGSQDVGIRRLEAARLAHEGVIEGGPKPRGELLSNEQVDLRLLDRKNLRLPVSDPSLTARIVSQFGDDADSYAVSVLDLSDPERPRYAEHHGNVRRNPGSVGKIAIVTGLFQALADVYPSDIEKRKQILRETTITADDFIIPDHHKVRLWNTEARELTRRPLKIGDRGTLLEFLDWMMSASSNAAASMVLKHAMLLVHFRASYPVPDEIAAQLFDSTPKRDLAELLVRAIQDPLQRNGIDTQKFRQGSFFTRSSKAKVPGTTSYATSRELVRYLLRMEQGLIVDEFSSREIKRLLYQTEKRTRYASSPELSAAAIYFKSGSLYSCKADRQSACKRYHGNKQNLMASLAIVESPANERRHFYLVAVLSNVLSKNSALAHRTLGTHIHRVVGGQIPDD